MTTSELATTTFCTRCGQKVVDGACPNACANAVRSPAAGWVQPEQTTRPARRSSRLLLLLLAPLLVCALLASWALIQTSQLRQALGRSNDALAQGQLQAHRLNRELRDLAATQQALQGDLNQMRSRLDKKPNDAATVERAARSVFTIVTNTDTGSGFVVTNEAGRARIVTNFHVVADGYVNGNRSVSVRQGSLTYPGKVVEVSESNDLAVISVPLSLPALPIAKRPPAIGDALLVLGSPLGLGGTVTSGIASAYRTENGLTYLQFSAPISPGNSGGPVIDEQGRVVGVSVLKMVSAGAEGLSFAIPASRLCSALSVC